MHRKHEGSFTLLQEAFDVDLSRIRTGTKASLQRFNAMLVIKSGPAAYESFS